MKLSARNILKIFVLALTLASLAGCVNYSEIELTSFNVTSINTANLKDITGKLQIGVDNRTTAFTVSDVEVLLYRNGTLIGTLIADPVKVAGKTKDTYTVPAALTVSNISILEILAIVRNFDAEQYTIDISGKVKAKGGVKQKISFKNIKASKLINMAQTYGA
ncbi:MAG: hypothetical protein LUC24_03290 [Bacteroidales bacterium]|nr:hypothetical protein [Bacteroidales bacterium]